MKPSKKPVQSDASTAKAEPDAVERESEVADRREFVEQAAMAGIGAAGLGALLSQAQEAAAAPAYRKAKPVLHDRTLNKETILAIQRTGMELIAYTYGVEPRGEYALQFLSIGRKCRTKTKTGTTRRTCCHADKTFDPADYFR